MTGPWDRYRELFAIPHLPGLLSWSLVGRLHVTCTSLVITFLVAGWTGSYALAGLVVGALTVCQTLTGPWWGRLVDRGNAARHLVVTSLGYSAGLVVLAVLPTVMSSAGWPLLVAVAAVTGLFFPPMNQVIRAGWPRLTPPPLRDSVYTVDTTVQELLFVAGPVLAAATIAVAGPAPATAMVAGFVLVGGLGFAVVVRRAGLGAPQPPDPTDPGRTRHRSLLADPGLVVLIAVMGLLVAGLVGVDLVIISWARDRGESFLAGALAGVWAAGSLLGGLVAGARSSATPPRLGLRLGAVCAGMVLLVPVLAGPASPMLLGVVLFLGGLAISPALAVVHSTMAQRAPEHRRAEAFGWQSTATRAGTALVAPAVGACLDGGGPAVGAAVAALTVAAAVAIVAAAGTGGAVGTGGAADTGTAAGRSR